MHARTIWIIVLGLLAAGLSSSILGLALHDGDYRVAIAIMAALSAVSAGAAVVLAGRTIILARIKKQKADES